MANEVARKLRKTMTRQEVKLWVKLRELRELEHHFRRQSPIANYVVDFECRRSRIVIEVDGNQHGFDDHRRRDEIRDKTLQGLGYRVLRFYNFEADRNFEGVLEAIWLALEAGPRPLIPPPKGKGGAAARSIAATGGVSHEEGPHPGSLRDPTLPEDGEG